MAAHMTASVCRFCRSFQNTSSPLVSDSIRSWTVSSSAGILWNQPVRSKSNKHYDPTWRRERGRKKGLFQFTLPDYEEIRKEANMSPDEMKAFWKRKGLLPPRVFQERNLVIASTSSVFEPYVPPEGDGIASAISPERAKQRFTELEKKGKSFMQVRKIRQFDEDFDTTAFAEFGQDMYIEVHNLLQDIKKNEERLHELTTEKAYPDMTWKLEKKTFRWNFIQSLEPPRVVHVRTTNLLSKDNLYAQVTVRIHSQQTLAIYDRFGRLMYGSESLVKDCLEYVVFEKHLADEYGSWRIHSKIIPDWMPKSESVLTTKRIPSQEPDTEDTNVDEKEEAAASATS